jgi:hypothetical protein
VCQPESSRKDAYRSAVPRLPKNFRIESVTIETMEPRGYLPTGPDTAVPTLFQARFLLGEPQSMVTLGVMVGAEGPVIVNLNIKASATLPVTPTSLRQMQLDLLLREAMSAAAVPASVRDEWLASLPPGVVPERNEFPAPSVGQRVQSQADHDAHMAAKIYSEAVAAGSKAPAVAVSEAMSRSRAQVARYIRRARELGLLPPLSSSEGA